MNNEIFKQASNDADKTDCWVDSANQKAKPKIKPNFNRIYI